MKAKSLDWIRSEGSKKDLLKKMKFSEYLVNGDFKKDLDNWQGVGG